MLVRFQVISGEGKRMVMNFRSQKKEEDQRCWSKYGSGLDGQDIKESNEVDFSLGERVANKRTWGPMKASEHRKRDCFQDVVNCPQKKETLLHAFINDFQPTK